MSRDAVRAGLHPQLPETPKIRRLIFAAAPATGLVAQTALAGEGVRDRAFGAKVARTIKAKTTTLASSHVAMLLHPAEVAKVIIEAARTAPVTP